jgi:hypothetical protein
VCNIYIGSSFLYSSTCSFLSLFCTYILTFICLFFFSLFFLCEWACVHFFFLYFHYCLFSSFSYDSELFFFSEKKTFCCSSFFFSCNFIYMCNFFYLFEPAREKQTYLCSIRQIYIYMCDGCIFGIKPTHCECWFQL